MNDPESMDGYLEAGKLMTCQEASSAQDVPVDASVNPRRGRKDATPVQRALALLTRREHSRQELARKLAARGVEPAQAEAAVAKLAEDGWQSNERFAELLIRSRAARGYGPSHIRAELGTHGLDREAVEIALETFDGDWTETACDLVRRRFGPGSPGDMPWQRKVADLLLRRGFTHDVVRSVLNGTHED